MQEMHAFEFQDWMKTSKMLPSDWYLETLNHNQILKQITEDGEMGSGN